MSLRFMRIWRELKRIRKERRRELDLTQDRTSWFVRWGFVAAVLDNGLLEQFMVSCFCFSLSLPDAWCRVLCRRGLRGWACLSVLFLNTWRVASSSYSNSFNGYLSLLLIFLFFIFSSNLSVSCPPATFRYFSYAIIR